MPLAFGGAIPQIIDRLLKNKKDRGRINSDLEQ
jgi:hypothetical protein